MSVLSFGRQKAQGWLSAIKKSEEEKSPIMGSEPLQNPLQYEMFFVYSYLDNFTRYF
jgi:hypothetical protein